MSAKAKAASKKSDAKASASKGDSKKPVKLSAAAKEAAKAAIPEIAGGAEAVMDPDEAEEQADEAAASRSSSGSGDAALAAAASTGEMSASFKNFRHHPDMENFYRFIYENDLRHEALQIIDVIMVEKQKRKALKSAKAQAH
jgi:hypothetical protein